MKGSSESIPSAIPPVNPELLDAIAKEKKLRTDYYEAINKHADALWMPFHEVREVSTGVAATRWLLKLMDSGKRRCGQTRQNVEALHVTSCVYDPDVRKKLVMWKQDTCKDLLHSSKRW